MEQDIYCGCEDKKCIQNCNQTILDVSVMYDLMFIYIAYSVLRILIS